MTSWGLQVWGLRPTTLHGHWLCDSLSCQRRESGLKQMLSGELLCKLPQSGLHNWTTYTA